VKKIHHRCLILDQDV